RVRLAVADGAYDLAGAVVPLPAAAGVARLRRRVVGRAVLAVRTGIGRVGGLRHLVVAGLRVRAVHGAEAAAILVEARAEAAEERDEERRDAEPGLIAALVLEGA